ncbi:YlaI family protein [Domibacillus sp. 8LH]|uniref:YlaI family protein n=1 Tax=Domibacillus TaxID=1433999 RepID=UPI001F57D21D|nr:MULTISPECIES: YlaI family protein [Domibacillus]MCI2253237.1 YlaI family protein [Domibacillus sp. PGB-M46]MCM3787694.1 YlaI family protein [Domibacillus indicus]WNS79842.1 YlaI family protein [Domibacillus sp. DTU_2020_1001157_1_SI_ALB_TIR_016]
MRVKCIMCDKIESIDDQLPSAKKLRNRPIHTYMCEACRARIAEKTEQRIRTGQFFVYRSGKEKEWLS